jgi:hypothetical protein
MIFLREKNVLPKSVKKFAHLMVLNKVDADIADNTVVVTLHPRTFC